MTVADSDAPVTAAVARFMANACDRPLEDDVRDRTKQHLLDSLVAMVSGASLPPGRVALRYAGPRARPGRSLIVGDGRRSDPETAALVNGICAHADETDDLNKEARLHPGASVVPAAVAVAEHHGRSGADLLRAVAAGYDAAYSVNRGAWATRGALQRTTRAPQGLGQTFGAATAAAGLAGLSEEMCRDVCAYAAQQASGLTTFHRDESHVEKAFASAGMQAFAGVRAVELVGAGFTSGRDVFDGVPNVLDAFGEGASAARMLDELAVGRHVMTTDIKRYPVGGPILPAIEALLRLVADHDIRSADVDAIEVGLPSTMAKRVDRSRMPDLNIQYILALVLVDGTVSFAAAHDHGRAGEPAMTALMARISVVAHDHLVDQEGEDSATKDARTAVVTVHARDGRRLSQRGSSPRGSRYNPMSWDDLAQKTHMALATVMPPRARDDLVEAVRSVDELREAAELGEHLAAGASGWSTG